MARGAAVFGLISGYSDALRFLMTTAPGNSNDTDRLDRWESNRAATFINRCNQDDVSNNVFENLTANINNCEYLDINYKITNSNDSDTFCMQTLDLRTKILIFCTNFFRLCSLLLTLSVLQKLESKANFFRILIYPPTASFTLTLKQMQVE